jgi:hypothetical protein
MSAMANENNNVMRTKTTKWVYDEICDKWNGKCLGCGGEKSQYTPSVLKRKKISPCEICTDMEAYEKASDHEEK